MARAQQPDMDFDELRRVFQAAPSGAALYQQITNEPFRHELATAYLFLGFITMFIVKPGSRQVKIGAVSDTEMYHLSVRGYAFEPSEYRLSLDKDGDNDIVKAILTKTPQNTVDWKDFSRRQADPEQARLNQANSGIAFNSVYPLDIPGGGALLFCYFQYQEAIGPEQRQFMERYSQLVSEVLRVQPK